MERFKYAFCITIMKVIKLNREKETEKVIRKIETEYERLKEIMRATEYDERTGAWC